MADKPGGQNPGVIEDQAVPRPEKGRQVIEMAVTGLPRYLIQGEQTGGIPLRDGGLRDELRRQIVIKIVCLNSESILYSVKYSSFIVFVLQHFSSGFPCAFPGKAADCGKDFSRPGDIGPCWYIG